MQADSQQPDPTRRFEQEDEQPTQQLGDDSQQDRRAPSMVCPDCGSDMVWARTAGTMALTKMESGIVWRGSDVAALVCRSCGLVKFYAENPDRLV